MEPSSEVSSCSPSAGRMGRGSRKEGMGGGGGSDEKIAGRCKRLK